MRRDDGDAQDRAALAAYYATHIYAPLWISNGALNAKAAAIVAEFSKADDWGLEAKDFAVPAVAAAPSVEALADAEVTLSLTALKYARYARGGRITDPATQLSSYLDRKPQLLELRMLRVQAAQVGVGLGGRHRQAADESFYDDGLKAAVMAFQKETAMRPDGSSATRRVRL